MSRRAIILVAVGVVAAVAVAWAAMRGLERLIRPKPAPPPAATAQPPAAEPVEAPAAAAPAASVPHIIATLYYGTADGQALAAMKREVPLGDGPREQGRQILQSQLDAAPAPFQSLIPQGTTLRAFYITGRGDAFVDLSPEVTRAHPGGTSAELLTVFAIVNAVTTNLPAVQRVQILVDGKAVETIAGHVDVRRPLQRNDTITQPAK
jgi:spore germination protein GerM